MKRLFAVLFMVGASLTATSVSSAANRINLPSLFADQISLIHEVSHTPIMLPETMPKLAADNVPQLAVVTNRRWELLLGAIPDCNRATACHLAGFTGRNQGRFSSANNQIVNLKGGIRGRYAPSRCGASCSPASIQWRDNYTLYTIDAKVSSPKKTLTAMANSAIVRGER